MSVPRGRQLSKEQKAILLDVARLGFSQRAQARSIRWPHNTYRDYLGRHEGFADELEQAHLEQTRTIVGRMAAGVSTRGGVRVAG